VVTGAALRENGRLLAVCSTRDGDTSGRGILSLYQIVVVGEGASQQRWCLELQSASPVLEGLAFHAGFLASGDLVVSSNDQLVVFSVHGKQMEELARIGTLSGGCSLAMAVSGNRIVIGEILRSVSIIVYDPGTKQLKREASDGGSRVCGALALVGGVGEAVVLAEHHGAVAVAGVQGDTLTLRSSCRSSHRITQLHLGSLAGRPVGREELLFVTAGGAVGLIGPLDAKEYSQLSKLEDQLAKRVASATRVEHGDYWGARPGEGQTLLDGDLILSYRMMDPAACEEIAAAMRRGEGEIREAVAAVE